jgi:hypothetical protein
MAEKFLGVCIPVKVLLEENIPVKVLSEEKSL